MLTNPARAAENFKLSDLETRNLASLMSYASARVEYFISRIAEAKFNRYRGIEVVRSYFTDLLFIISWASENASGEFRLNPRFFESNEYLEDQVRGILDREAIPIRVPDRNPPLTKRLDIGDISSLSPGIYRARCFVFKGNKATSRDETIEISDIGGPSVSIISQNLHMENGDSVESNGTINFGKDAWANIYEDTHNPLVPIYMKTLNRDEVLSLYPGEHVFWVEISQNLQPVFRGRSVVNIGNVWPFSITVGSAESSFTYTRDDAGDSGTLRKNGSSVKLYEIPGAI